MRRTMWVLVGSILGGVAACADAAGPDPAEQIFTSALAQWNELGPDSYDLVLKRQCICQPSEVDVTIQVRNGTVASRFYTATGDPVSSGSASLYPDVPGLFQVVRNAMDGSPLYLSAEYDQTYGHPVLIQLDMEGGRSDDNVVYISLSLTPVQ